MTFCAQLHRWQHRRALLVAAGAGLVLGDCSGPSPLPPDRPAAWHQIAGPEPSARWGHAAVFDPKRRQAVVFGGTGGGSEVWTFSFASYTWRRIDAANGPTPRWSPSAVADPTRDRIVVFGGVTSGGATNETWAFNLRSDSWSQLPTGPSARFDVGSATDGTRAWFYDGFATGFVALDELWEFDLASNAWTPLPQSQPRPSPRTNMGLAAWGGSLYMTGGHDVQRDTPGTWRYDLLTHVWVQLSPTDTAGAGAHFASDVDLQCGDLILAAGDHDDAKGVSTTDQLMLRPVPRFVRLATTSSFPPRRHASLVLDPLTRQLLLVGGIQGQSSVYGDTWLYQLGGCPQ